MESARQKELKFDEEYHMLRQKGFEKEEIGVILVIQHISISFLFFIF